jgi:hypothetical protein
MPCCISPGLRGAGRHQNRRVVEQNDVRPGFLGDGEKSRPHGRVVDQPLESHDGSVGQGGDR